jgi:hypothetical protein
VHLASSSTHADHETWLVDSGASFHMTPHREWLCEYERYGGDNVFLSDESTTKIIGRGKFKLRLIDGRIRKILGVLHILGLAINLISIRKMDDVGVKTMFEKETCRMVQRAMVLLKGVHIGTLYKIQGINLSNGCNSSIISYIGAEELKTLTVSRGKVMLWHKILEHNLGLARNLISISKMDDARVKKMFEKETCRMVQREIIFLKGVCIGTLYKLQGRTISNGCNSSIAFDIGAEE